MKTEELIKTMKLPVKIKETYFFSCLDNRSRLTCLVNENTLVVLSEDGISFQISIVMKEFFFFT